MRNTELHVDRARLDAICREHDVARLDLFGSFVRGSATDTSDVDLLVTFAPGAVVGLRMVGLQLALEALFGRRVDLLTRDSVERSPNKYLRHFVLRDIEPFYAGT